MNRLRVAVVGASLGGLSVANVLHRLDIEVAVFEYFPSSFHNRGGALGNVHIDLIQRIRGLSPNKMPPSISGHGHFYGDLWAYLYQGLPAQTVHFGADIREIIDPDSNQPGLRLDGSVQRFDLVIGADGGKSAVRAYVTDAQPSYSGYALWRGLAPVAGIAGPPSGSKTLQGFRYDTLGFPFVGAEGETFWNCGIYMAMPESDVAAPSRNRQVGSAALQTLPDWFQPFVTKMFGADNARFWRLCAERGKVSQHAVWEFSADRVVNKRIILLGDAAHMASPRTGAGAYTAMVDALVLAQCLTQALPAVTGKPCADWGNLSELLERYNSNTVKRGQELFIRSRQAAAYFAPLNRTIVAPEALLKVL